MTPEQRRIVRREYKFTGSPTFAAKKAGVSVSAVQRLVYAKWKKSSSSNLHGGAKYFCEKCQAHLTQWPCHKCSIDRRMSAGEVEDASESPVERLSDCPHCGKRTRTAPCPGCLEKEIEKVRKEKQETLASSQWGRTPAVGHTFRDDRRRNGKRFFS